MAPDLHENETPSGDGEEGSASFTLSQAQAFLDAIKTREDEFSKGWWKKAKEVTDIYEGDTKNKHEDEIPYNILYSNTEVLLPALYSATPKPDIRSRFKGSQLKPIPELLQRFLAIAADPASPGADSFDGSMQDAVLSSLVPGAGYVRMRLKPEKAFPITYESGHYTTLIWGKASRWSKVPWVAFKHTLTKQQMFEQFEIEREEQITGYTPNADADEDTKNDCCVYELWDKQTKKVYFLCEEWHERLLAPPADDPLGLENFFPTPGPLLLTVKPGKLAPVPLYNYYRKQAEELNRVSVRLNKILSAIRVRGAYNSLLGEDLKKILSSDELENELIPASEAAMLAQAGGFDKHIWLLPIDQLIRVAQELYKAREAIKQVIYELTGISDIIRGSSVASETATAQDLKNKWGTVRLRRMQAVVANYARDLFRMTIDCASDHVPPQQWKEIVQLPIPLAQEKAIAQQQLAYMQAQQSQVLPMPGQLPQPFQPPPELAQAAQSPSMEELLAKVSSDMGRTFVVNIQTSSTVDLDTAQDKAEVGEFMNAMGQLMGGLQPLLGMGPSGLEAAKAILVSVCQRYKFGIDIADVIAHIQPPPPPPPEPPKGPPPPSPEEQALAKAEAQAKMQQIQLDTALAQARHDLAMTEIQAAKAKLSLDIELAQVKLAAARAKAATPTGATNANVPR